MYLQNLERKKTQTLRSILTENLLSLIGCWFLQLSSLLCFCGAVN